MNEADTRAEKIEPWLRRCGWGEVEGSRILREYHIAPGKIKTGGIQDKPAKADYVLVYKNVKLAVIEAKSDECAVGEGVAQAKDYALRLQLKTTYATNGNELYYMCLETGKEATAADYLSPDALWEKTFGKTVRTRWQQAFADEPFNDLGGTKKPRYYQELAVNHVLEAIANNKPRVLLTLATGTGKTHIAFEIAWKLFQTRWNLQRDGGRRPRILFLADRNILANQAFNDFSGFAEDALVRINPGEVKKNGRVPTNGSVFFTIFQTFMSGPDKKTPYFGQYPKDYFDLIIIDECHRGGANDEGNWRGILEYFEPAVQLGLTATPKRKDNVDTYRYFGEPVYVYSLKQGINDGFLTPFKVRRIQTTIDDYTYTPDDEIIEGEVEEGRQYTENDFNRIIEIKQREAKRVQLFMDEINQQQKTIVFCATQEHAGIIRDLINQYKTNPDTLYCVRVTANDGARGDEYLKMFRDNEKTIPTILTTSQKLSTGVDARNIRNIVLLRPVNNIIEFKQIIGRGTRLFEGKTYFTIYDFVNAYNNFFDPEWDGDPAEPPTGGDTPPPAPPPPPDDSNDDEGDDGEPKERRKKIKIKLGDGKVRNIQHMASTSYWSPDGTPLSAEEFIQAMFGKLPAFYKTEEELRAIWSEPATRKALLEKLADAGYGKDELADLQQIINAEDSDLFDALEYVSFAMQPITRAERVQTASQRIYASLSKEQKEFLQFVLEKYVEEGVEELDQEKLPQLLMLKYHSISDAEVALGDVAAIRQTFIGFQKYLYS